MEDVTFIFHMLQCQANKKKHHHRTAHYLNIIQKHQICSNNATGSMYKKQEDSKDTLLWHCSCLFLMDIQLSHSGTIDAFQSHQRSKWWTAYRNLKVEARDFVPIVSPQPTTDTKVDCSSDKSQTKKKQTKKHHLVRFWLLFFFYYRNLSFTLDGFLWFWLKAPYSF